MLFSTSSIEWGKDVEMKPSGLQGNRLSKWRSLAKPIGRIDGDQSADPVGIRFEELAKLLLLVGGQLLAQRVGGGAGNVQREHAFDPHPLHVDHRLFVLAEVSLPQA